MSQNSIRSIGRNTWCIEEKKGTVYGYLLTGDERAVLIDTGLGTCDYRKMADSVTTLPIDVINTHGHIDHVSGNASFDKVYIHAADSELLKEQSMAESRYAFLLSALLEPTMPKWLARSWIVKQLFRKIWDVPYKDNAVTMTDGEEFDLGGRVLTILHTPGHTPGSVCILDVQNRRLFSGDTICDEGVLLHFDHSRSVEEFLESCRKLKAMDSQWDEIWPAHHKKPVTSALIDDYIACAGEILAEDASGPAQEGMQLHQYGGITISYMPGNIRKRPG